jgi:hypothetical protein
MAAVLAAAAGTRVIRPCTHATSALPSRYVFAKAMRAAPRLYGWSAQVPAVEEKRFTLFTVADATTLPFRAPISRNATRGLLGFNTTVTILAVLRQAAREIYRRLMDAVDPALVDQAGGCWRGLSLVICQPARPPGRLTMYGTVVWRGQAMMRVIMLERVCWPGGRRWLAVVAAVLAACGVAGAVPPAALAGSSSAPDWTQQAPVTSPSGRTEASMAYDPATSTTVLFGGDVGNLSHPIGGTWTWDGSTWTQQAPATSPSVRDLAAMAYDAATGTIVLFGGFGKTGALGNSGALGDTWTWNGSTWTRLHPAASPAARYAASMAYDAATGTIVLFGGFGKTSGFRDTWTWDGTTWAKQAPATRPPDQIYAAMAYDAATSTIVLFGGGGGKAGQIAETWTWDGTTWTRQAPATSPPNRSGAAVAYDAATSDIVMFGGHTLRGGTTNGTWTWDGTTWAKQAAATSPSVREFASMAYDAATSDIVLFGGNDNNNILGDTWTWGG